MSEFEDKLNSILNNPVDMEKITRLASQFMGGGKSGASTSGAAEKAQTSSSEPPGASGLFDEETMAKISRFMTGASEGNDKTALLSAMMPYMSSERRTKLEKAVRFAKIAKVAGLVFGENGGAKGV